MISNLKAKIKESAVSVVPVMAIVTLLHFTITPLPDGQFGQFLVGGTLLILGLGVFLIGADLGMVPFGQKVGSALTRRKILWLILLASFLIGFAITIAEPDVQVLAEQVRKVAPELKKFELLVAIALGVGFFLVVGMLRVFLRLSLRALLIFFYVAVFGVCFFVEPTFVGIAFDSGGATTGPITVPFIMAMGIGVATAVKTREGDDNSFGFVGLASIGPIAAVAVMGLFSRLNFDGGADGGEAADALAGMPLLDHFLVEIPHVVTDVALALAPLVVIFAVFQLTLLKLPAAQLKRMITGFVYTALGLIIFLVGVNGGFTPVGQSLGELLGGLAGGWALVPVGFVLGAVVVCAEPAVWVLTEQVEEVSGGTIRRRIMLAALSISVALAVTLGMLRVVTGLNIWWILVPGYALALGLTRYAPPLFTAIAFDSGGVASGPMSTTFVLALALGGATALPNANPATDAFGMVAMIAMAPLITIQILGLLYDRAAKRRPAEVDRDGGDDGPPAGEIVGAIGDMPEGESA